MKVFYLIKVYFLHLEEHSQEFDENDKISVEKIKEGENQNFIKTNEQLKSIESTF